MEGQKIIRGFVTHPQNIAVFICVALILILSALNNYLLFHTMLEGLSVIFALMIFIVTSSTYKYSKNHFLLFTGTAFLFVGLIDFAHITAYYGMGIFNYESTSVSTLLWIAGRYIEIISILIATFYISKRFNSIVAFWIYALITAVLVFLIMSSYSPLVDITKANNLNIFKIISATIICLIAFIIIIRLNNRKKLISYSLYRMFFHALVLFALSVMLLTIYTDNYGLMNFIGHILKLISYLLIFLGAGYLGMGNPYIMLSDELKISANHDLLTGLYNRRGFEEQYPREMARLVREGKSFGIIMIDLDNFKSINDKYGHKTGDEVLKKFSSVLQSCVRETDIVCRMGGDEFLIMANEDTDGMKSLQERILDCFSDKIIKNDIRFDNLGMSSGTAVWDPGSSESMDDLTLRADKAMYNQKAINKKCRSSVLDLSTDIS